MLNKVCSMCYVSSKFIRNIEMLLSDFDIVWNRYLVKRFFSKYHEENVIDAKHNVCKHVFKVKFETDKYASLN